MVLTSVLWLLLPLVALCAGFLTAWMRRYALARSLMDTPNARSSHAVPTPRGGGVAIVVSFLCVLPVFGWAGVLAADVLWAIVGAGLSVAVTGFLDDHGHIAARWRLLVHFLAAIWALVWLGGMPVLPEFAHTLDLGWVYSGLAAVYLVWVLNLYNFMDGIDGIASVEAICVCGGGGLLYWALGMPDQALPLLALAAAVGGFLYWNFPPAKIFMGDAGSGFLGIVLGVMSIQAAWVAPQLFWAWLILLGVFVVDATLTLMRRLLRGDKVYQAHRSHAYQYASRALQGHRPVTLSVALINGGWLVPIAFCVGLGELSGPLGMMIAYAPLVLLALGFRAGKQEKP